MSKMKRRHYGTTFLRPINLIEGTCEHREIRDLLCVQMAVYEAGSYIIQKSYTDVMARGARIIFHLLCCGICFWADKLIYYQFLFAQAADHSRFHQGKLDHC